MNTRRHSCNDMTVVPVAVGSTQLAHAKKGRFQVKVEKRKNESALILS